MTRFIELSFGLFFISVILSTRVWNFFGAYMLIIAATIVLYYMETNKQLYPLSPFKFSLLPAVYLGHIVANICLLLHVFGFGL